jgi:hypothetical protein
MFGCQGASDLLGRARHAGIEVTTATGMKVSEVAREIEAQNPDVRVVGHATARLPVSPWYSPSHYVDVRFRSTVQPKASVWLPNVSPETYANVVIDFVSTGLWELDGEVPS